MSVTISIEALHTGAFDVRCWDYDTAVAAGSETGWTLVAEGVESFDAAVAIQKAHALTCDCGATASAVYDTTDEFDVNLANANFARVAVILGLDVEDDWAGSLSADDFHGRVLVALGFDHAAIPTVVEQGRGGATFITGGFDPLDYLPRLVNLAIEAKRLGRDIQWS